MENLRELFDEIVKWNEEWNQYIDNSFGKKEPMIGTEFLQQLSEKYKVTKHALTTYSESTTK